MCVCQGPKEGILGKDWLLAQPVAVGHVLGKGWLVPRPTGQLTGTGETGWGVNGPHGTRSAGGVP